MTRATCIAEPVSWLALELHALGRGTADVAAHVDACAACRACLDEIRRDVVALPVLVVPPRRRWWTWAMPAAAAVAAAAIVLLLLRPREATEPGVARVKGVGEVVLDVLRERAGTVRDDVREFAPGDRWKVVVTCPLAKAAWIDVTVVEDGARAADYPLPPARVICGNRVFVPGAFELTGTRPHHVCVRVAAEAAPPRALPRLGEDGVACVTLTPAP